MLLEPTRLLCPRDSPGRNTGVDCHFLLQGKIFQGIPVSPASDSLPLSHLGSPTANLVFSNSASQLQDLRLQDIVPGVAPPAPPGEGPALLPTVPQFLPYYICVVNEDDYTDFVSLDHAQSLLREYQQREGVDMEQ